MDDCHVYPVAVIGGGSAGTMAVLRTVLNNDETIFFREREKTKSALVPFGSVKWKICPGICNTQKGLNSPTGRVLSGFTSPSFDLNSTGKKLGYHQA